MNCSQILYLCRPETTERRYRSLYQPLWIALKFCIFVVLKQRLEQIGLNVLGCELLSNFVSLSSWNNKRASRISLVRVVNCSQILYLCRPETTSSALRRSYISLWIALKFCIFVVLKQPRLPLRLLRQCCELLSNFVSLSSWNNVARIQKRKQVLWIALKFCIFVVLKQLCDDCTSQVPSCELLSNFVSLSSWNHIVDNDVSSV